MCTVSWAKNSSTSQILFNRDERHNRLPGFPPEIRTINNVSFISPIDGDAGGTWLGVNEFGCVFGLLNFYPDIKPTLPINPESRGTIIHQLAFVTEINQVKNELKNLELNRFEPFEFLFLNSDLKGTIARWDGSKILFRDDLSIENPLSSSSFVTKEIVAYRRGLYLKLKESDQFISDLELQDHFHFAKPHENPAWNPLMYRNEARTVSVSKIIISKSSIYFNYTPIEKHSTKQLNSQSINLKRSYRS